MPGLRDIAAASETVDIRGHKIDVHGVPARTIAELLNRFPELRELMSGREVDVSAIYSVAGNAVAPVIAAATGDEEADAERLGADDQAVILEAALRLTFPSGVGPFVDRLAGMGDALGGQSSKAPDTKSPKQSKG